MTTQDYPFDAWDMLFAFGTAVYPSLAPVALGQFLVRRNAHFQEWKSRAVQQARAALPKPRELLTGDSHKQPRELLTGDSAHEQPQVSTSILGDSDIVGHLSSQVHLLVVGHTGGGKTTLMHAIARALAPHSNVVFLDPDGVRGKYPGYRVVGAGDDYQGMGKALMLTNNEVAKRREARANGQRRFPPVWILVDEAHDVVAEIEGAWPILEGIIRRGRKLNVHVAIGTQDNQVRTLGLEGKSKLLDNLTRVDVKAASAGRVALVGGQSWNLPHLPCADDTVTTVPQRAAQKTANTADTALLDRLLVDAVQGDTKGNTTTGTVDTDTDTSTADTDTSTADTDTLSDEQIRQMAAKGISKRRIAQKLKGTNQARLARINAALDSAPAATDNQEDDSDDEPPPAFRGLLG